MNTIKILSELFFQDIPTRERIKMYEEAPGISQSQLKAALEGPASLTLAVKDELYYEDEEAKLFGNLVDRSLTFPEGLSDFYQGECVSKPSAAIQSILNEAFDTIVRNYKKDDQPLHDSGSPLHLIDEEGQKFTISIIDKKVLETIQACMNKAEYSMNLKKDNVMEDSRLFGPMDKEGLRRFKMPVDYWNDLINGYGKKLVSAEQMAQARTCLNQLRSHPATSFYTTDHAPVKGGAVFNQVPIFQEWSNTEFKGLLDRVIYIPEIEDSKEHLIQVDFKTMSGPTSMFRSRARKFRYDIQGRHYTALLKALLKNAGLDIEVKPFTFVVNSVTHPYEPTIYRMTDIDMEVAYHGMTRQGGKSTVYMGGTDLVIREFSAEYRVEGILDAMVKLDWYRENGNTVNYDYSPENSLSLWTE